jgi:hypothetical protein
MISIIFEQNGRIVQRAIAKQKKVAAEVDEDGNILKEAISEQEKIDAKIEKYAPKDVPYWIIDSETKIVDLDISELDVGALGDFGSVHTSLDGKVKVKKDKKDKKSKKEIKRIAKQYMDEQAKGQDYESIIDLCSHISSGDSDTVAEAQAGIDFRDAVKSYTKQLIKDIKDDVIEVPTEEVIIAGLPAIVWPV